VDEINAEEGGKPLRLWLRIGDWHQQVFFVHLGEDADVGVAIDVRKLDNQTLGTSREGDRHSRQWRSLFPWIILTYTLLLEDRPTRLGRFEAFNILSHLYLLEKKTISVVSQR
jgi:hypothetical protein